MERDPFAINEWYHCYSRGIDKRRTFTSRSDYERFLGLLYICNDQKTVHRSDRRRWSLADIVETKHEKPLVALGAFCLMPNHFHLLVKEITDGGISSFMRKLGTAYAMYFNIKYERAGNLFAKPFRSRHVADDSYLQHVLQYIHCNPAEIFEPYWKEGKVKNMVALEEKLLSYPYSSFGAFTEASTPLRKILDESIFEVETQLAPQKILSETRKYYEYFKVTP